MAKLKCAEGDWQAGRLDHEMSRKIRVGRFPDTGEPRFAFWTFFFNCGHQVSSEFEFGIKENWDQINVITMEDRLDALE